jgi:predicted alpha/beta-hydrolase family hydrolase
VLILLAHGAGAGPDHPWMRAWATRLSTLGRVVPFAYPYMAAGSRRPDRLPALIEAHREVLASARRPGEAVVLAGKSMGGRVGCHLSLEESVQGVVCFGYPLVGSSARRPVRDQVLLDLRTPVLFVQGTRDRMCPLAHLAEVRARMTAPSAVHVVPTGDHSLLITCTHSRLTGRSQADEDDATQAAVAGFVGGPSRG